MYYRIFSIVSISGLKLIRFLIGLDSAVSKNDKRVSVKDAEINIRIGINSASIPPRAIAIGVKPPATVPTRLKTFPRIFPGTAACNVAPMNELSIEFNIPAIIPSANIIGK